MCSLKFFNFRSALMILRKYSLQRLSCLHHLRRDVSPPMHIESLTWSMLNCVLDDLFTKNGEKRLNGAILKTPTIKLPLD